MDTLELIFEVYGYQTGVVVIFTETQLAYVALIIQQNLTEKLDEMQFRNCDIIEVSKEGGRYSL